jgi:hypothetical protein
MKPILILPSDVLVAIAASLLAQELRDEVMPAILPAAMAALINARRFMIEPDSFLVWISVGSSAFRRSAPQAYRLKAQLPTLNAAQWPISTAPFSGAPVRRAA